MRWRASAATTAVCPSSSTRSGAVGDPTARQVVRRDFDGHAVARDDADEVLAHLAADVSEDLVPAVHLDAELGVGEGLDDRAFEHDGFFFGHRYSDGVVLDGPRTPGGGRGEEDSSEQVFA